MSLATLRQTLERHFPDAIRAVIVEYDELTIEINAEFFKSIAQKLRDDPEFAFNQLIDICVVDYQTYGYAEWETESATATGFDRGVTRESLFPVHPWQKPRFGVVYHLLSLAHNERIRLRAFVDNNALIIDSAIDIWPAANWFEREAFDLFGIIFNGHPDLRRILTDYGFIGHPFRKDFPLIGNVEVRYDAHEGRVIYEPVNIKPRTLVPKIIRDDSRYVVSDTTKS